ncbi:membrane protein [Campylobacter concisus]|uniref:Membrane protein n=1 Tax=Campylobacter concisus UNSW2 TaxID=1242965 RepID=U2FLS7_9BACT|nr:membrane protein [Campylobacter concisus]ERJ31582.1 membrane protein [Campylobacter concisus UNSW2]
MLERVREFASRYIAFSVFLICLIDFVFLLYAANSLSISYNEAEIFFQKHSLLGYILKLSAHFFGQNDLAVRGVMIFFHIASVVLMYKVSKFYIKLEFDRIIAVLLFVLLPGTLASALIINNAGICITLALLCIYLFHIKKKILFSLFFCLAFFIDGDFLIFYAGFFIFALYKRKPPLAWLSAILFLLTLYFFGFETNGRPSGHFIDTFGIFAAVFSPFVFIFFVYTIYRIWVKEKKDLLWFIAICSFCFCMIVSVRQRLELEQFLPFCVIATPLMVRVFFNSYRVRLPKFRKGHKICTSLVMLFLIFNWSAIIFNQIFYLFLNDPTKHLTYKFDVAKELADKLKEAGVQDIATDDTRLALRLKFYGIKTKSYSKNLLASADLDEKSKFSIEKMGKVVANFNIKER